MVVRFPGFGVGEGWLTARVAVWESAKADFGPLLPRFQPPVHPMGLTRDA